MAESDVLLDDPRALRALAHPTRLALLDHLASGPATATEAGGAVGISASAASYHLRALARWGLVEEAGGGRGRERPWKARGFSFEPAEHESAAGRAAVSALMAHLVETGHRATLGYLAVERSLPRPWRRAGHLANATLQVTAAEAQEVTARIEAVLAPYYRSTRVDPPADARPVRLLLRLFLRDPERA